MTIPVFDTLKAAKALKAAGFDDSQAEAVVATVDDAVRETLVTKADLENALRPVAKEKGLNDALRSKATKADLLVFQQQITIRLGGLMIAGFSGLAAVIKLF